MKEIEVFKICPNMSGQENICYARKCLATALMYRFLAKISASESLAQKALLRDKPLTISNQLFMPNVLIAISHECDLHNRYSIYSNFVSHLVQVIRKADSALFFLSSLFLVVQLFYIVFVSCPAFLYRRHVSCLAV